MYSLVLLLHSWLRWVALAGGILAVAALAKPQQEARAERFGLVFMIALDLQMLLGLWLYLGLSPNTAAIFNDFGAAMRDPGARFWGVEHATMMTFAVVIVHVGRVLARKAATASQKRTRLLVCFVAALFAIVAATPWPGLPNGRPLFRV